MARGRRPKVRIKKERVVRHRPPAAAEELVAVGDRVRKVARRNHRGSGTLGEVVELFTLRGRPWARVASGEKKLITTAWPVRHLKKVVEDPEKEG